MPNQNGAPQDVLRRLLARLLGLVALLLSVSAGIVVFIAIGRFGGSSACTSALEHFSCLGVRDSSNHHRVESRWNLHRFDSNRE